MKDKNVEGHVNLLFEIFGLTDWDIYSKKRTIKTKISSKKHWWTGMKKKPTYYKRYKHLKSN